MVATFRPKKGTFRFDVDKVLKEVKRGNVKNLFQAGNLVRTVAARSIRNRPSGLKRGERKKKISDLQRETFLVKIRGNDPRVVSSVRASDAAKRRRRPTSLPGSQPFTGRGRALRKAIRFEVSPQKDDVVVGTDAALFDQIGERHEKGGTFDGKKFPKRAFMLPALLKVRTKLPRLWANSIKG